ncbi:hypothetical protein EHS25_008942 [Saitozyma podzolica]|uniref:Uncharacterized protein n=1 Tax=Saitozyma podzolica TaxID=1890683 RepID=A0A427YN75_9TREE|nr:hypothetical protein EHS25_008942 [Saitozyma podzolica]
MSKPVALIFGAGPKVGAAVVNAFTNEGYAVAIASRSANDAEHPDAQGLLSVKADLAKTEDVKRAFERTKIKLGTPSVVIHNASTAQFLDAADPLGPKFDVATFAASELGVNAVSVALAAQLAVQGFATLPASASKTFIYTGNGLSSYITTAPVITGANAGKSAAATLIANWAAAYKDKGYKFYYADERTDEGGLRWKGTTGPAAAKWYVELSKNPKQLEPIFTFTHDKGYVKFDKW